MDENSVAIVPAEEKKPVEVSEVPAASVFQPPIAASNYTPTIWNNNEMMKAAWSAAKLLSQTDMIPMSYRNKPGNCFIAIDMASRMNVSPLLVMGMLNVIQGNASWNGQGCIALINNCGRFTPIEFEEEMREDGYFSCVAYATEKASGKTLRSTKIDKTLVVNNGWWDKNNSYWRKMPQQMARYRAAAFFARTECPEALMGLYTTDEIRDMTGQYDVPTTEKVVIDLNKESGK